VRLSVAGPSLVSLGACYSRVINAVGSGSVRISMDGDGKPTVYELRDVYYVPNMGTNNLLSVTYMSERNYLWILKGKTLSPTQESAHVARASINTWHRRLGHAMTQSIKKLVDQSMVTGMEAETKRMVLHILTAYHASRGKRLETSYLETSYQRNRMSKTLGDYTGFIPTSVAPLMLKDTLDAGISCRLLMLFCTMSE